MPGNHSLVSAKIAPAKANSGSRSSSQLKLLDLRNHCMEGTLHFTGYSKHELPKLLRLAKLFTRSWIGIMRLWFLAMISAMVMTLPLFAAVLPSEFILKQTVSSWKDFSSIVLQREVLTGDAQETVPERLFIKNGRLRIESGTSLRVYPDSPRTIAQSQRPGIIDALFLLSLSSFVSNIADLGIDINDVTLARFSTPEANLPFLVVFRLGTIEPDKVPQLHIEKDRFRIRRLEFREQKTGPWWTAIYDGYGTKPDIPDWMPTRIEILRDGLRFELVTAIRRLNIQPDDSSFTLPH